MDSLRIKDRRTWFRYSEGKGGDAIDFLQQFEGKSFKEAVEFLLAWNGRDRDSPDRPPPVQRKEPPAPAAPTPFVLPPANGDNSRVTAYLKKRGIAPAVIRGFVDVGLLYEDAGQPVLCSSSPFASRSAFSSARMDSATASTSSRWASMAWSFLILFSIIFSVMV